MIILWSKLGGKTNKTKIQLRSHRNKQKAKIIKKIE